MKIVNFFIILISKVTYRFLKIIGKKGGTLPGYIALKMNKRFYNYFKTDAKIIVTTATNGKTTTNNWIASTFENQGYKVICNRGGNNIGRGIASTLLINSNLFGKIKSDYIILEIDEHWLPVIGKYLKIDSIVVLNFFRDQLDRSGELNSLILKLGEMLESFNGNLILNGDDPNVTRLSLFYSNKEKIFYYQVDEYNNATKESKEAGEGKFCPICNTRLDYNYYQYSHIGKFNCPQCDFGDFKTYKKATNLNVENGMFKVEDKQYKINYKNIYNIYNALAVISVTSLYEISENVIKKTLETFKVNKGRLETFIINNRECTITVAKNPTSANVSLKAMDEDGKNKDLLFVLNDNVADGYDVSWIWDINLSYLKNVDRVICSGLRAYDMAIRMKNGNVDINKIEVYEKIEEAVESLFKTENDKFVITNYTAIINTRENLIKHQKRNDN